MMAFCYASAQPRLGIIAGGVMAKTSGPESKGRFGAYGGVEADVKLGQVMSFRPQLKYIMKGESITLEGKGAYNYVELPLNFVYYIPTTIGRFSVGAGPVVDFMVHGSWTMLDGTKEAINYKFDKINRFDFGVNLIGNYEINERIFFSINYSYGLQDVWTANYIGNNQNRAVGLGIGIMF